MTQGAGTNWSLVWSAVSAIATAILVLPVMGAMLTWFARRMRQQITDEWVKPLQAENAQLLRELETRLRIPTFSLHGMKVTEMTAKRLLRRERDRNRAMLAELEAANAELVEARERL